MFFCCMLDRNTDLKVSTFARVLEDNDFQYNNVSSESSSVVVIVVVAIFVAMTVWASTNYI
jgi:hypothetical protein